MRTFEDREFQPGWRMQVTTLHPQVTWFCWEVLSTHRRMACTTCEPWLPAQRCRLSALQRPEHTCQDRSAPRVSYYGPLSRRFGLLQEPSLHCGIFESMHVAFRRISRHRFF